MNYFINYKNGTVNVNTYREVSAEATTIEDIYEALQNKRDEVLTASLEQDFEYDADLKTATFSGICYSGETGFEICTNEEAHNVESEEAARAIWGLDEDLCPAI